MAIKSINPPLVVVAGQIPPPTGGQNVMIKRIVDELKEDTRWRLVHLPFRFTSNFQSVRRFTFGKVLELLKVYIEFLKIFAKHGKPELLLYPSGGPQLIPIIRDILLLPFLSHLSKKTIVQFHAAGVAERLYDNNLFTKCMRKSYSAVQSAIVMTSFNKRDPESLGIPHIWILPHRIIDENPKAKLPNYSGAVFNILYAGHLYDQKGTPQLIEAFANIAQAYPQTHLHLLGEFLPPYSKKTCIERLKTLGIVNRISIHGVQHGVKKSKIFSEAQLFVFPSIAPYESFGLVMVEAMMWGLPIMSTDWRGNRDVAGDDATYISVDEELPARLCEGLRSIIHASASLPSQAGKSRKRYETHFQLKLGSSDYRATFAQQLGLV